MNQEIQYFSNKLVYRGALECGDDKIKQQKIQIDIQIL